MNNLKEILKDACDEEKKYLSQHPSIQKAWEECRRGDLMLQLAFKLDISLQELTLAKGLIAQTVIHLMIDPRSKKAVEVAIAFGKGKATLKELEAVSYAAVANFNATFNAFAANDDAATYAAFAAFAAANATLDTDVDSVAIYAAEATSGAFDADVVDAYNAAEAARKKSLQNSAEICRKVLTKSVFKKLAELREK